ncbi:MAG: hypothetical protein JWQ33_1607, partial [Ramlibacter sp.]|nr:hypothetical protein [Ramlibacter sp.]
AKEVTLKPGAAVGRKWAGQPMALAVLTVGTSDFWGAGRTGLGPTPAFGAETATVSQAARAASTNAQKGAERGIFMGWKCVLAQLGRL